MKLYLAGNSGGGKVGKERELMVKKHGGYRLFSYYWIGKRFYQTFQTWVNYK